MKLWVRIRNSNAQLGQHTEGPNEWERNAIHAFFSHSWMKHSGMSAFGMGMNSIFFIRHETFSVYFDFSVTIPNTMFKYKRLLFSFLFFLDLRYFLLLLIFHLPIVLIDERENAILLILNGPIPEYWTVHSLRKKKRRMNSLFQRCDLLTTFATTNSTPTYNIMNLVTNSELKKKNV